MFFHFFPIHFFRHLLKTEASQFFTSIAIRNLALGMILIFEPIYLYLYFGKSLSLTVLFFAAVFGLYGLLVVFGARIMAKTGLRKSMLISHFFFFSYYLCLFFFNQFFLLTALAIILKAVGMILFWPAFHIDFALFSKKEHRGRQVGKLSIAGSIPIIISPILGGWILTMFGYPGLFTTVLIVLFASAIPLFLSKKKRVIYTDSFIEAWQRVFKKENRQTSLAFISSALEGAINCYLWPLFMFILAISYAAMGGITSFALVASLIFTLYMGKISDTKERNWVLNIGAVWTSIAWIIKYFVTTSFDAFLAHTLYRICRTSSGIPFQTIFYEKTAQRGHEADEFIIYYEIVINISKFFFLAGLAGIFLIFPYVNIAFLIAAVLSLGFMFLGKLPKFKFK